MKGDAIELHELERHTIIRGDVLTTPKRNIIADDFGFAFSAFPGEWLLSYPMRLDWQTQPLTDAASEVANAIQTRLFHASHS